MTFHTFHTTSLLECLTWTYPIALVTIVTSQSLQPYRAGPPGPPGPPTDLENTSRNYEWYKKVPLGLCQYTPSHSLYRMFSVSVIQKSMTPSTTSQVVKTLLPQLTTLPYHRQESVISSEKNSATLHKQQTQKETPTLVLQKRCWRW